MKWLNGDYAQTRASEIKHLPSVCEAFFLQNNGNLQLFKSGINVLLPFIAIDDFLIWYV